jgi:ABC-2 type transport system ATP-binding protein
MCYDRYMIKTAQLTKQYNSLTAVNNLSLNIKKGEVFGFIGPNGAGKTTTIKMLVGILPPTKGSITINEFDVAKKPMEAKKIIGYIPDTPYVYPYMTGREFLHFVAEIYRIPNKVKKINHLLKLYPIERVIDGYFKDFSRGTKQKLSILAALLHDPKALIIDEPILGLDPASAMTTKKIIKDFGKKGGTVFVSSHTLPVIQEICHRIGVIDKGKLVFQGTITQLKTKLKAKEAKLEKLFLSITRE